MKNQLFICLSAFLFLFACRSGQNSAPANLAFEKITQTWHNANEPGFPKISAHRGGMAYDGYPENALETIQFVFAKTGAIIECDIAETADGQLVLMHDNTLERTTTCNGRISNRNWSQIDHCQLKDPNGNPTSFEIPTLEELLDWADDRGVLFTLDVKRGVAFEKVIATVRKFDYFDRAAIITYQVGDAMKVHQLAPEAFISVAIRNEEELRSIQQSGIPRDRLIAFTGTSAKSARFYQQLDDLGIPAILGTLGNLDQQAAARGNSIYQNFIRDGVDILATNRPLEAFSATYSPN